MPLPALGVALPAHGPDASPLAHLRNNRRELFAQPLKLRLHVAKLLALLLIELDLLHGAPVSLHPLPSSSSRTGQLKCAYMKGASNRSSLTRLELLQGEIAVRYQEELQTALFFR